MKIYFFFNLNIIFLDNSSDIIEFVKNNYHKDFTYQEFAKDFTTEFFDPKAWAEIFKKSGAKYAASFNTIFLRPN